MAESPIKPRRRWSTFSLRTLFVAVTLAAALLGWVALQVEAVRKRDEVRFFFNAGEIDYPRNDRGFIIWSEIGAEDSEPSAIRRMLGDERWWGHGIAAPIPPHIESLMRRYFPTCTVTSGAHPDQAGTVANAPGTPATQADRP